jgi:hypothetical protein
MAQENRASLSATAVVRHLADLTESMTFRNRFGSDLRVIEPHLQVASRLLGSSPEPTRRFEAEGNISIGKTG